MDLWEVNACWLSAPNLWYFVMAAWEDQSQTNNKEQEEHSKEQEQPQQSPREMWELALCWELHAFPDVWISGLSYYWHYKEGNNENDH